MEEEGRLERLKDGEWIHRRDSTAAGVPCQVSSTFTIEEEVPVGEVQRQRIRPEEFVRDQAANVKAEGVFDLSWKSAVNSMNGMFTGITQG